MFGTGCRLESCAVQDTGAPAYVTKAELDAAVARLEGAIDLTVARMEVLIERATVTQIRWLVGTTFGLYALMFGLILFVVSRELAH